MMHYLRFLGCPLLSVALVAQQLPPTPSSAEPAKPPTTISALPDEPPSGGILQDGTPIKLRLLNPLNSRTAKPSDEIQFEVVNHLVVGGVIVLRRGSAATGVVTEAEGSKTMGRAGKLSFTVMDIELRNGIKIPVRAFHRTSGENRTADIVVPMLVAPMVAAPFFLLVHGTNTVFPRGTEINAYVNGDLRLELGGFDLAVPRQNESAPVLPR
jgi:hypothetical protein